MNKYTIYEPPQKGKALIKMFLVRAVSTMLLLTVSFIYAQSPGGVAGASLWLRADNGVSSIEYFNVPAANRTASTTYPVSYLTPAYSTIDSPNAWSSNTIDTNQYLTLDLGSVQPAYGVVTQGRTDYDQWTRSYKISYSNDNVDYTDLSTTFSANTDRSTKVINIFPSVITARYIRIKVTDYYDRPSMRADVIKNLSDVSTDNSAATVWKDQSSNGMYFMQRSANAPVYLNSGSAGTNFNPVIQFNGSNYFENYVSVPSANSTNYTKFAVFNTTGSTGNIISAKSPGNSAFYLNTGNLYMYHNGNIGTLASNTVAVSNNIPTIGTGVWSNGTSNGSYVRANGKSGTPFTSSTGYTTGSLQIGAFQSSTNIPASSTIAESIIFSSALSPAEVNKVESYLAIKYGITLGTSTAPVDYTNAYNTVVWTGGSSNPYQNNIAGIGRDDALSGLYQKQSQSVNGGFQPIIGKGNIAATNSSNGNTFNNDGDFLVWGSDTGSTTFSTPFAFNGLNYRMPRIWKMQKTGSIGIVKVAIPVSMWPVAVTKPTLLISGDATFDGLDSNFLMKKETIGGIDYYVTDPINLNITSGQFFSFAGLVTAPGGIVGASLWLKADNGVTYNTTNQQVSVWNDLSVNPAITSQATKVGSGTITYANAGMNFNPTVNFDGTSGTEMIASNNSSIWDGALTIYGVAKMNNAGNLNAIFSSQYKSLQYFNNQYYLDGSGCQTAATSVVPTGTSNLAVVSYNGNTLTTASQSFLNGQYQASASTSSCTASTTNGFEIGGRTSGSQSSRVINGSLAEVIVYNAQHTGNNLSRLAIESYLGIKYGITLSRNNNGNATSGEAIVAGSIFEGDYVASDGSTKFWSSDATYQNNIAGIGRDDASGLNQKQSQSTSSGIQPIIGNIAIADTNANNNNGFGADMTFMVWGSDTGSTSFATPFAFGGLNSRMARIWKVQETKNVGKVRVAFKVSDLPGSVTKPTLLVSGNTTFDGSVDQFLMTKETIGGVEYYLTAVNADIDFSSGKYFSFAAFVTAPGGVLGASLWLKGNKDVSSSSTTLTQWLDQTQNNNFSVTNTIQTGTQTINFNNAVYFNGSGYLTGDKTILFKNGYGMYQFSAGSDAFTNTVLSGTSSTYGNAAYFFKGQRMAAGDNDADGTGGVTYVNTTTDIGYNKLLANMDIIAGASASSTLAYVNAGKLVTQLWVGSGNMANHNSIPYIGRSNDNANQDKFNGLLGELMMYPSSHTDLERLRINSYLGIKYGLTLSRNNNGNTTSGEPIVAGSIFEGDYVASNGSTKFWSTDATYQNNIAGIGRDDASALNQKQSQSVNGGIQPVIGNVDIADTSANNTNDFTADKSFLVWGSDTGSTSFATPFAYGSSNFRMTRIWKIQKTGTIGTVKVAIPVSQLPLVVSQPSLLISADATFDGSDTRKSMTQVSLGGVQYYVAEVDTDADGFTSGHFFSFAGFVTAPGGVSDGLKIWHKADAGITTVPTDQVTAWTNQVDGRQVANNALDYRPKYSLGGNVFNFNPYLDFTDTKNALYDPGAAPFSYDGSLTWFMSSKIASGAQIFAVNQSPSYTADPYDDFHWITGGVNQSGNVIASYSLADNTQSIITFTHNGLNDGTGNRINGYKNLTTIVNNVANSYALGSGGYIFGNDGIASGNDLGFVGKLSEFVAYNKVLQSDDIKKVQSYLAIKTGVTLNQDHIASDGLTKFWDNNLNSVYSNNIAGIGKDNASALFQKQSQSVNTGNQLIVGLGEVKDTNAANTGTLNNLQFLVWGDNNEGNTTDFTGIVGYNSRLKRVWKVQNTNNVNQSVQVLVPSALVPATSSLLCGTDPTFGGNYFQYNPAPSPVIINSVSYRAFTVPAVIVNQDSFYMTLAFYEQSPGGVRGEALWLRGDAGLAGVKSWLDQSGNNNHLSWDIKNCNGTHNSRGQMTLGNTLNFNPVARFGPPSDWTWAFTPVDISRTNTPYADVAIIYKADAASVQDVWSTDWGGAFDERSLTTTQVANDNTGISYSGGNSGFATINIASFKSTDSNGSNVLINGNNTVNFTGNTRYTGCTNITLGDVWGAQNPFTGKIGEFVVYKKNMSAIERIQLNSYLALKYGITLGRNNDGNSTIGGQVSTSPSVSEGDYLASNGTTKTWLSDAVYQNNVVGIGRDDISAFHQRITTSQSATPDIITLSTDSNFTNNNQSGASGHADIVNDKFFFVTGNNNGATSYAKKSGLSNGLNALMKRVWKVQRTGTAQDVYIKTTDNLATYLVYSNDPTFSSNVQYQQLMAGATQQGVQIQSGYYFTFATFMKWPGGVEDEVVWLRGDIGLTGTQTWLDQSGNSNNLRFDINDCLGGSAGQMTLGKTFNYNSVAGFGPGTGWTWGMIQADISRVSSPDVDVAIMYKADAVKEQDVWGTDLGGILDERSLLTTKIANDNHSIGYSGGNSGYGTINIASFKNTVSDGSNVLINGNNVLNFTGSTTYNGCSVIRLGDVPGNREDYNPFTGIFGEFVVFKKNITASQRIQLNTYLALKYGITLGRDNNGNGTAGENISAPIQEGDYLASYSTDRIWESDAVYQNNVIGIGRDDITALHQRITKSQMPVSDIITLSTDSNFTNNNQSGASGHTDIANDKYYFITGHNGQPTTFMLKSGLDHSLGAIMNRVWKVQQRGTVQDLYLKVNNIRAKYLIYSPDPTFSSNVEYEKLDNDAASGTSVTHDGVRIPSGNYFTFAATLTGPGGVTDNLVRWYRADRDVVTGSTLTWKDQTVTEDAKQDTAANQPVYNTSGASLLNFNPSFSFDAGQSKFMFFKDTGLASSNSARSVFGLGSTSSTTAQWLTSYGTSSAGKNFGLISSGNNVMVSTYGAGNEITASSTTPYLNNTPVVSYGAVAGSTLYGAFNAFTPQNMTAASVITTLSSNSGRIGTDQSGSNYWNGTIGEVVYYNKIPTPAEKARVDSYLALKYGVTLGNNSTAFSYVGSDGNTFWTGSNTYQNNIAGIGRDDISDLIQRQSQSANAGNQVIIGIGNVAATNEANTSEFENNLRFLVWGDNNTDMPGTNPITFTAVYPYQERLSRVWRVQNTKNIAKDIQVLIPAAYIKDLKVSSLLYSTDPAFPAGSQVFNSNDTGMVTINSVDYKAFTIPAAKAALSQFYFTMAYYKKSPGGVTGENLWLRADDDEITANADDTSVATWKDQSGNNSHGTQAASGQQPKYRNNATDNMNFNPVLAFNGGQHFDITGTLGIDAQKNVAVFAVSDVLGAHYFLQPKVAGGNLLQFSSAGAGFVTLKLGGSSATNTTAAPSGGSAELYAGWRTAAGDVLYSGINAKQLNTAANTTVWTGGNLVLGIDASGNATNGKIPEMVEYSKSLDATQLQKVNSYLALKYGITLDQSIAPNGQDYLASDGNKSWTADATYKYNIAGIGRDDLTALNQKQSQSVNKGATANIETDSQLLVALDAVEPSNTANTNTFSADMQYMVWGDDNGSLTTRVATGNVASNGLTYTKRFSRVWKVQNKGSFADKIGVYYPVSAFGNASSSSVGLIFASTAAKLSDGTAFVIANSGKETINGTEYYAFYVSGGVVPSLNYLSFTTATSVCYKPAVTAGTALGTKAGITALGRAGVNADNWPMVRKGGWMALEAKTKGMIINRVRFKNFGSDTTPDWRPVADNDTTPILTSPVEGMIVMDLTNRMLKVYTVKNGVSGWYEIGQQTCPD
jgi:F5/8 type C domain